MDWRFRDHTFPDDEEEVRKLLAEEMAEFPLWGMVGNILADSACKAMDEAEKRYLWHKGMGREGEAEKAMDRMEVNRRLHRLGRLLSHADMILSMRGIVEGIVARHRGAPKPGSKDNPIDAGGATPPAKRRKGD
jgi:hypothetical protein